VPVDGFFEWQATKGGKAPFVASLWENWKDPATGDWVRTFTILTVPSNELIARIHDRMPAILRPADYERWLGSASTPFNMGPQPLHSSSTKQQHRWASHGFSRLCNAATASPKVQPLIRER